jgi:hypothetical protein
MRDRYGSDPRIMMLAELMQRVEYDLDLSDLYWEHSGEPARVWRVSAGA